MVSYETQERNFGVKLAAAIERAGDKVQGDGLRGVPWYDGHRLTPMAVRSLNDEFEFIASKIGTDTTGADVKLAKEPVKEFISENGGMSTLAFIAHARLAHAKEYPKALGNDFVIAEARMAMTSGAVGVLPLDPNGTPVVDVARKPRTVLLNRIPRRAHNMSTFRWNFIVTASVAEGLGTQEAPTMTADDDTYDNHIKTLRSWHTVRALSDISPKFSGRGLLNEFIEAGYRALDEYEEEQIYTGTGAGVDPWIGLNGTCDVNTTDLSGAAITLDNVRDQLGECGANSPIGALGEYGPAVGVTDYDTWSLLDDAIGVNRQQTPTGGRDPGTGTGVTWREVTFQASANAVTTAAGKMIFLVDPSTLLFADAQYRLVQEFARTTTSTPYGITSWSTLANLYANDSSNSDGTGDTVNAFIDNIA